MITYRRIFTTAWQITWHQPGLWLFGLFASVLNVGGEIQLLLNSVNLGQDENLLDMIFSSLFSTGLLSPQFLWVLPKLLVTKPFVIFIILLFLLVVFWLIVLFIWLVVMSQGALIRGVTEAIKNKKTNWPEVWSGAKNYFWPVLFLNAGEKAIFWLLFLALSLMATFRSLAGVLLFLLAFMILVALLIVISFVIKYTIFGVVLKKQKISEAFKSGLNLFSYNWLLSLEMAILWFVVFFITQLLWSGFIRDLIIIYLSKVFYFLPWSFFLATGTALVLYIFLQIILSVFYWTTWTLLFEVISSKKNILSSRIMGGFHRLFN